MYSINPSLAILSLCSESLEDLRDLRVVRLEAPIQSDVLERVFSKKGHGVLGAIGLIQRGSHLFDQLTLDIHADPRTFHKTDWPYFRLKTAVLGHVLRWVFATGPAAGFRINSISPGHINTPMTLKGQIRSDWYELWMKFSPMKRIGESPEIAPASLFLASDASSFFTGRNLVIDDGYTCW